MLVRHFVGRRLAAYYAQPAQAVVGTGIAGGGGGGGGASPGGSSSSASSTAPVCDFRSLWGEWQWKRVYGRLYQQEKGQWLTPVELFRPYYSNAIANFIVSAVAVGEETEKEDSNKNLDHRRRKGGGGGKGIVDVVELGGGRGTNALLVLDHLERTAPELYDRVRYTIVDASPTLVELQSTRLLLSLPPSKNDDSEDDGSEDIYGDEDHDHDNRHADKIRIEWRDLLDVAEGRESLFSETTATDNNSNSNDSNPTVVVALELLDNLPHDKVRLRSGRILEEAHVDFSGDGGGDGGDDGTGVPRELFVPLSDPLLKEVLEVVPSYYRGRNAGTTWVPTVACGVLLRLAHERPHASVLLADFDWLPPPDLDPSTTANDSTLATSATITTNHSSNAYKPARGEPLVTSMDDSDFPCYLNSNNTLCDILFPTDFGRLSSFVQKVFDGAKETNNNSNNDDDDDDEKKRTVVNVQKQSDFLLEYGPEQVRHTQSWLTGYSPMTDDFGNCSVLTRINTRPTATNNNNRK